MSTRAGSWPFDANGSPVEPDQTTNGVECASPAYLRLMRAIESDGDAEYVAARVQIVDVDATPVSRDRRLADEAAVPLVGEIR